MSVGQMKQKYRSGNTVELCTQWKQSTENVLKFPKYRFR